MIPEESPPTRAAHSTYHMHNYSLFDTFLRITVTITFLGQVCKRTTVSAYDVRIRRMKHNLAGDTKYNFTTCFQLALR